MAITVLSDDVCRACSKIFGSSVQCPACRSVWQTNTPIFDPSRFNGLPPETVEALELLEKYEIPAGVLSRLVEKSPYSEISKEEILVRISEFKKFTALLVINLRKKRSVEMMSEEIDDIWHTFILFTKEYQDFCEILVGEYIHHEPNVEPQEADMSAIGNYNIHGIRNFAEDYERYFGSVNGLWHLSFKAAMNQRKVEAEKRRKKTIALTVTLILNAALVAFLARELAANGYIAAFFYTAGANVAVLLGAITWSRNTTDEYDKSMVAVVVMMTFVALLGTAIFFALSCAFDIGTKNLIILTFVVLFIVVSVLFGYFRGKRAEYSAKYGNTKSGCAGGAVGISCSGGGGGCGGGCGGGGC